MKPKTTILMVLAIGCGLAAAFMTNKLIAERSKGGEDVEKITVLVAKAGIKKIPAMTFVKKAEDFFEPQERTKSDVPKNALTDLTDKDLKDGFRVSRTISEGNYLTHDDLISREMEGLSRSVPMGMRAVAIRVTAEMLVGGFVLPGSKVDVVWTFRTTNNLVGSLTILQDMLVLAVDTQSGRNPENPQTILGATVTLAVKPEEAQKLSLASGNGELRLSLRSVGDDKKVQLAGSKPSDLAQMNHESGDSTTDPTVDSGATPPAAVPAPPIPEVATKPVPAPTPTPATTPAPAPETPAVVEKPKKIHRMLIQNGQNVSEHRFVFDEESQSYEGSRVKRSDVDGKSEDSK